MIAAVSFARDRPIPRGLDRYIKHIRVVDDASDGQAYRRLPDGETELVIRFGTGPTTATVVGTRTQTLVKPAVGRASFVLIRFSVAGAYPFFVGSMSQLTDHLVPVADLWNRDASGPLTDACDGAAVERASLDALAAMLTRSRRYQPLAAQRVQSAVSSILSAPCLPSASQLARDLGASERHLRRVFGDVVGISPKRFLRIMRFQRALSLARASASPDWAAIAQDTGYFDQAHLIADFRELAGSSPMRYLRSTSAR